jgi:hypothetical protein
VITARTLTTDGLQLAGLNRGLFMPTGSWVGHELVGYAVALLLQFYILLLSHTVTNPSARWTQFMSICSRASVRLHCYRDMWHVYARQLLPHRKCHAGPRAPSSQVKPFLLGSSCMIL